LAYWQLVQARNQVRRRFFINLAIALAGGLVSLGTYGAAASSPTGGTYLVFWGAMLFGGVRALRCAWHWSRCARALGDVHQFMATQ